MDNLILKLMWEDENLFELNIEAKTKFISINENVYFDSVKIKNLSDKILEFVNNPTSKVYYESGPKSGKFTTSFSIDFKGINDDSKVVLEIEMEIDDNEIRSHWANFYLYTELGYLERFAKRILNFPNVSIIELNDVN